MPRHRAGRGSRCPGIDRARPRLSSRRAAVSVVERIRAEHVVAVLRRVDDPARVVDELVVGGIGVVELTLDSDDALGWIGRLRERGDVAVLAGTVRTPDEAAAAVAAGAEGCVGPAFSGGVLARCRELDVPCIPGALTPTEIEVAWRAGAALVKLFPARSVGARYVTDVLKPLVDVPLLCTGGVTVDNAAEFLAAGAAAVGISFRGDVASEVARLRR